MEGILTVYKFSLSYSPPPFPLSSCSHQYFNVVAPLLPHMHNSHTTLGTNPSLCPLSLQLWLPECEGSTLCLVFLLYNETVEVVREQFYDLLLNESCGLVSCEDLLTVFGCVVLMLKQEREDSWRGNSSVNLGKSESEDASLFSFILSFCLYTDKCQNLLEINTAYCDSL